VDMSLLQIGEGLFARNVEIDPLTKRFSIDSQFQSQLDDHKKVSPDLIKVFQDQDRDGISLSQEATVSIQQEGSVWQITDGNQTYTVKKEPNQLSIYVPADLTQWEWSLIFSKIEGSLTLSGSTLPSLDLTGTQILGDLLLGSKIHSPTKWWSKAKLTLRNTQVAALQDLPDAWPDTLVLFDDIDLKSWARYYFYFHQLMGYVIAAFLAAGLSGLVK
jgi:hypothetical protein